MDGFHLAQLNRNEYLIPDSLRHLQLGAKQLKEECEGANVNDNDEEETSGVGSSSGVGSTSAEDVGDNAALINSILMSSSYLQSAFGNAGLGILSF